MMVCVSVVPGMSSTQIVRMGVESCHRIAYLMYGCIVLAYVFYFWVSVIWELVVVVV